MIYKNYCGKYLCIYLNYLIIEFVLDIWGKFLKIIVL